MRLSVFIILDRKKTRERGAKYNKNALYYRYAMCVSVHMQIRMCMRASVNGRECANARVWMRETKRDEQTERGEGKPGRERERERGGGEEERGMRRCRVEKRGTQ